MPDSTRNTLNAISAILATAILTMVLTNWNDPNASIVAAKAFLAFLLVCVNIALAKPFNLVMSILWTIVLAGNLLTLVLK